MNNQIFFFFYNLAHQSAITDKIVIFFAVYFPYIVSVLAVLFLLFHHDIFKAENPYQVFLKKKKEILLAFFAGVAAWIFSQILKLIIHTPRPFAVFPEVHSLFSETGYAFPSGHATFFGALAVALFFSHKKAGYIFMCAALFIGIARVVAGVHFPVDILGGFILGALVSYFFHSLPFLLAFRGKNV